MGVVHFVTCICYQYNGEGHLPQKHIKREIFFFFLHTHMRARARACTHVHAHIHTHTLSSWSFCSQTQSSLLYCTLLVFTDRVKNPPPLIQGNCIGCGFKCRILSCIDFLCPYQFLITTPTTQGRKYFRTLVLSGHRLGVDQGKGGHSAIRWIPTAT